MPQPPLPRRTRVPACLLALVALALSPDPGAGQNGGGGATLNAPDHPLLQGFEWRSIGPTGQGGRVDDLAVHPTDSRIFYVGFATGGLWKTTNRGTTFESIFDHYGTHSVGALRAGAIRPRGALRRDG